MVCKTFTLSVGVDVLEEVVMGVYYSTTANGCGKVVLYGALSNGFTLGVYDIQVVTVEVRINRRFVGVIGLNGVSNCCINNHLLHV